MSGLAEFREAMYTLPDDTFPSRVWGLLLNLETAWAQAEAAPISENEAARWSPVCDAALTLVTQVAVK